MKQLKSHVKPSLTKRIAQLHEIGFCHDFALNDRKDIVCLQDDRSFDHRVVDIRLVDQAYDRPSGKCFYVHTVETDAGDKGLLVMQNIYFRKKDQEMPVFDERCGRSDVPFIYTLFPLLLLILSPCTYCTDQYLLSRNF